MTKVKSYPISSSAINPLLLSYYTFDLHKMRCLMQARLSSLKIVCKLAYLMSSKSTTPVSRLTISNCGFGNIER